MDTIKIYVASFAALALGIGLPVSILSIAGDSASEEPAAAHAPSHDEHAAGANYLKAALESTVRAQGQAMAQAQAQLDHGKALYQNCFACHGAQGEGNVLLKSPALAAQESWYILSQLQKYKNGVRGKHPEDIEGMMMAPLLALLPQTSDMEAVSTYLSSLPFQKPPAQLSGGDLEAGKALYVACAACHGANGLGNPDLKSPAIAGQADWYVVSQLEKFKGGIRGYHADDVEGKQMVPMMALLPDEQAMINVATYIHSLR
jgi:cytochrome c oxidase subunit II